MQGHVSKGATPPQEEERNGNLREPEPSKAVTSEQRLVNARRLNPHARGSAPSMIKSDKPEGLTPMPTKEQKKVKPTKWQFGIRSRNSPSEAMLAIFKALKSMGAVWEVASSRKPQGEGEGSPSREEAERERERRRRAREGSQSPEYSDSDPDAGTDPEYTSREDRDRRRGGRGGRGSSSEDDGTDASRRRDNRRRTRGRARFGPWNDWGYSLPEDPWIINARFRKDGMFPPGVAHPTSSHSSRVDLADAGALRRRSSTVGSQVSLNPGSRSATPPISSANASTENFAATGPSSGTLKRSIAPQNDQSCWVYVTIQLYCIERDSFMVDFKCAGYERLTRKFRSEVARSMSHEQGGDSDPRSKSPGALDEHDDDDDDDMDEGYVGFGRFTEEKDISSPFPFMDVAASLIVSLAQRD